jgi:hypothetical protein
MWRILFLWLYSSLALATQFTDLKFSRYQIADSQWNVSACMYTTTCQIYSKNPGTAYKIPWTSGQLSWAAGDYVQFLPNMTNGQQNNTNPWLAVQYTGAGVQKATMGVGHIINMGTDYFFFVGSDNNTGQLFSMTSGFSNTSGVTWTGTLNPSIAQTNTYANGGSTTPLAAGQTASSPTVTGTSTATVVTSSTSGSVISYYNTLQTTTTWSDGSSTVTNGSSTLFSTRDMGGGGTITAGQQSDVNLFNSNTITDNKIYIRHSGNNDSVTVQQIGTRNLITGVNNQFAQIQDSNNYLNIKQGNGNPGKNEIDLRMTGGSNWVEIKQAWDGAGVSGGNNYALVNVGGFTNNITTQQTNDGGSGHFLEATVSGNYNTVNMTQSNDGTKQAFVSITGNNNSVTTTQSGSGQHYANVSAVGNGNTAVIDQSGSTANNASVTLINAGAPASVNLTQTGGKNYSITQTCYTACGTVTVRQ